MEELDEVDEFYVDTLENKVYMLTWKRVGWKNIDPNEIADQVIMASKGLKELLVIDNVHHFQSITISNLGFSHTAVEYDIYSKTNQ